MGRLEVITGPMFSGKSEELIKRLTRAQIGGKGVRVFKPTLDDRGGKIDTINSHAGSHFECESLLSIKDHYYVNKEDIQIVGIDEAQFFDAAELWSQICLWRYYFTVIVAGLNLDFRRLPFGCMQECMSGADHLTKLNAICHNCKSEDAIYTQRLIDGEPVTSGPTIQVGGLEAYEARCYKCFREG